MWVFFDRIHDITYTKKWLGTDLVFLTSFINLIKPKLKKVKENLKHYLLVESKIHRKKSVQEAQKYIECHKIWNKVFHKSIRIF